MLLTTQTVRIKNVLVEKIIHKKAAHTGETKVFY